MTIEELLEIEEIRALRALWGHYYDGREIDKLAELFTEDAVCEFSAKYGGNWTGRAQIRENYRRYGTPPAYPSLHAGTNHVVTLRGPLEATGRWYLLDVNTREGVENPLTIFGVYDDVYRKVDGAWKIHRARLHFLWPDRVADKLGPLASAWSDGD
ncbi:MAG: nuclear transport factor 2 family protein [Alphaproteobacteria bacterium]|nr:nuclear transport factor 2 family protein [Alphaproteobacteria bacterium]